MRSVLALAAVSAVSAAAPPAPPGAPPAPPVQVTQQQAPPPPRAPPAVAPHGIPDLHHEFTFGETTETATTTEDWHEMMAKLKKEHVEDNKLLAAAGHHWTNGVWLYGDYKNNVEVFTAHECADECEKDNKCLHWCFELEKKRCDLRSEGGGLNEGAPHWITGHAKRWSKYEAELKRRESLKKAEL